MANVALTEELDAINAIYGQETLSPLGEYAGNIRLRLGLPTEEKLVYWLQFESDYPHTIPQIEKAELSLHQSTDRRNQNIFLILFTVLQEVFVTGNVCLFDLVDGVLPLIASLCNYSLKNESGQSIVPSIVPLKWKWTCKPFIDMDVARNTMQCQTCFDKLYAFEMILVPCGHFFCFECFARGWKVVSRTGQLYTCCLQPFPLTTIKTYLNVSSQAEFRYKRLVKVHVPNALFCGKGRCGELIGSFSEWDLSRGKVKKHGIQCPSCKEYRCIDCREVWHPGPCLTGVQKFYNLFNAGVLRRCLTCGQGIEKNGGCHHVKCRCGADWWWATNGKLEKYTSAERYG